MFVLIARQLDRVPGLEGRTGAQSAKGGPWGDLKGARGDAGAYNGEA